MLKEKRILLIVGGGIAAYKAAQLIRLLRKAGAAVTPVLTQGGAQFITPLTLSALAEEKCYTDLFDLTDEAEMGHIRLSRAADLVVVAPATADLIGKMASGRADDLASTLLLATDKRVLIAPAMNVRMWEHPAVQRNIRQLMQDGILLCGPEVGDMACGEHGPGRMAEPEAIVMAAAQALGAGPLRDKTIVITSGPTHEAIDPVRYIANRSSGAQGAALAAALRDLGAEVRFITGPAEVPPPSGVAVTRVTSAVQMRDAVHSALPADAAIMLAAVADWRVENAAAQKMKKDENGTPPMLTFTQNPDILAEVAQSPLRPKLLIGFAAETENLHANAAAKRLRKGCDWLIGNDVSAASGIMGGSENAIVIFDAQGHEDWPRLPKAEVAKRLALRIAACLETP